MLLSYHLKSPLRIKDKAYDDIKKFIVEDYKSCFGGTRNKSLDNLKRLGYSYNEFGKTTIHYIYDFKFGNDDKKDKKKRKRKTRKNDIRKNLIGSGRFLKFSDKLAAGVYKHISVPITYFVKMAKLDWHKFCKEVLAIHDEDSSDSEENEEGN